MSFTQKVLSVVANIPKGKTLSYQDVAKRAGSPHAYRAVGSIMRKNKDKNIPCHRVICSDGSVGKFNRGVHIKKKLLQQEGACSKNSIAVSY